MKFGTLHVGCPAASICLWRLQFRSSPLLIVPTLLIHRALTIHQAKKSVGVDGQLEKVTRLSRDAHD